MNFPAIRKSSLPDLLSSPLGYVISAFILASMLFLHSLYIQYPLAFSDEALYALHTKFLNNPRFPHSMPNILYFLIYYPTSWFGDSHLVLAKLYNASFFALSLFPMSATACRFLSRRAAYVFSLAVVLSPVSSYSVYVMPESLYFFNFWVLAYFVVVRLPCSPVRASLYAGLVLAALSAVKPHGLVLIPVVPIVLLCLYRSRSAQLSRRELIRPCLAYVTALVAGRIMLNYLIEGHFIVSPFGSYYAELLTPAMRPKFALLSSELWYSIRGHFCYLAVLFWPAILVAVWPAEVPEPNDRSSAHYIALLSFSVTTFSLLILMAAKYTADVMNIVVPGQGCRVQGRYYDFAFGMLVLLFLGKIGAANLRLRYARLFGFVLVVGAIGAGVSAYFAFGTHCASILDFPEAVWFSTFPIGRTLVIVGCVGSAVALAVLGKAAGTRVYLTFIGSLAVVTSGVVFIGQMLVVWSAPAQDLAAIAVRNLVPAQIDDGIVLARTEDARSYRAMFQLYSLSERKILANPVLTARDIPQDRKWALLLDPYTLELPYYGILRGRDFVFVEFAGAGLELSGGSERISNTGRPR